MTDNQLIIGLILLGGLMIGRALVRAGRRRHRTTTSKTDDPRHALRKRTVYSQNNRLKSARNFMLQNLPQVVAEVRRPGLQPPFESMLEEGCHGGTLRYPHVEFCGAW